jgi:hypothetical protein
MAFRIWNFGSTREIPYRGKPIFLQKGAPVETDDPQLAAECRKYPYIEVQEIQEPKQPAKPARPKKRR